MKTILIGLGLTWASVFCPPFANAQTQQSAEPTSHPARWIWLYTATGWILTILPDGSGKLVYGAGPDGAKVPTGTFDFEAVHESLQKQETTDKGGAPIAVAFHRKGETTTVARNLKEAQLGEKLFTLAGARGKALEEEQFKQLLKDHPFVERLSWEERKAAEVKAAQERDPRVKAVLEQAAWAEKVAKEKAAQLRAALEKAHSVKPSLETTEAITFFTATAWTLNILPDGSGKLLFGAGPEAIVPPGTFDFRTVHASIEKQDAPGTGVAPISVSFRLKGEVTTPWRNLNQPHVWEKLLTLAATKGKSEDEARFKKLIMKRPFLEPQSLQEKVTQVKAAQDKALREAAVREAAASEGVAKEAAAGEAAAKEAAARKKPARREN